MGMNVLGGACVCARGGAVRAGSGGLNAGEEGFAGEFTVGVGEDGANIGFGVFSGAVDAVEEGVGGDVLHIGVALRVGIGVTAGTFAVAGDVDGLGPHLKEEVVDLLACLGGVVGIDDEDGLEQAAFLEHLGSVFPGSYRGCALGVWLGYVLACLGGGARVPIARGGVIEGAIGAG